jgi:Phosphatidylserine/phosphatidylglycerophosphate/cardiolipin synthases and related enzymes
METKESEKVVRLAKPVKKGPLRLVFSRFLIIVLLIVLQISVMISVSRWLRPYIPWLNSLQTVFVLAMVLYLFNSSMSTSAKLTWMLIISVLPLPGAAMLLFVQTNLGHRAIQRRVEELIAETKTSLPQDPQVMDELRGDSDGTDDLARYMSRSGCFPISSGTETTYYSSGEDAFEAMLAELETAEEFIFLEFFIIEEGYMWGRILETLIRKVSEGVDVRVMYDGMCELNKLPFGYTKLLREYGIKAKTFAPIRPVVSSHYNYRDHRKILVVDGRAAFTGGVNLADEYINRTAPFGHWKDTAILLRGRAVRNFTLLFLQMWNIDEPAPEFSPWLERRAPEPEHPSGYVMPYGDCPLDTDRVGETVYMDILYRANDYVHIMTPYLILDSELKAALCYAAQRGVDVTLILPGIPDKKMAYALAKSHYAALTDAGVRIYEYTPGFVHAKVCVSDSEKAVVGTINLDYRSLYHHFECASYLFKTDCIANIEADFQNTLLQCRPVTAQTIAQEKLYYKAVGWLAKFIAPLM